MVNFAPNAPNTGDENLTEQQLRVSGWYLTHKFLLRKILAGIIIGIAGILWLYSLIFFVDWLFISGPKERQNLKTSLLIKTDPQAMAAAKAENLAFGEPRVYSGGVGKYDFLTEVKNSNDKWWAEFEYRFIGEGLEGQWRKTFLLPGDQKYAFDLGVDLDFRPLNVRMEMRELKYHRISPHRISNYEEWRNGRLNIEISDKLLDQSAMRAGKNVATLVFKAKNNSAYSFWSVRFYALLYRGEQLASVNYITLENFISGETREAQMSFYEGLPTITKFEILPEVNIFDEENYIK